MVPTTPRLPILPPRVPRRGHALSRAFGRLVFLGLGWRVEGNMPDLAKCVLIAAPHTSTADIVIGVAAKLALGLDIAWLGKHTVHRGPLKRLLRNLGAVPVDRSAPHGVVGELVAQFRSRPRFYLGLAPEGTRRRVSTWKSGFHRIAVHAEVPIVTLALDYPARTIRVGAPFNPTDNFSADLAVLRQHFTPEMAFRPERYESPQPIDRPSPEG